MNIQEAENHDLEIQHPLHGYDKAAAMLAIHHPEIAMGRKPSMALGNEALLKALKLAAQSRKIGAQKVKEVIEKVQPPKKHWQTILREQREASQDFAAGLYREIACQKISDGGLQNGEMIIHEVLASHGLLRKELMSTRRWRKLVAARNECYYFLREDLGWSLPFIGRKFGGKDHTTIYHGYLAHAERHNLPYTRNGLRHIFNEDTEVYDSYPKADAPTTKVRRDKNGRFTVTVLG